MKRILALVLSLLLIFPLATGAFAEQNQSSERTAKSIALTGITLPGAGKKIPSDPAKDSKVKILVSQSGKAELQEITGVPTTAIWSEKDSPNTPLTGGTFVSGRTYRLTVTLEFQDNAPKVKDGYTEFTVNNEKATHLSNEGEKILFTCDFSAVPANFTPKVSLETSGEKTKEYDGEEITLSAKVEEMDGISYTYTWYKDSKELKDEDSDQLKLKNVSDSGEYSCKVTAYQGSADSGSFKTTKSATVKIEITPHTVIIKIDDAKKDLFAKDPDFTYTVKGDIYDELKGKPEREEGEEAGSYKIGMGTLSFEEKVKENYLLEIEEGTLTIESTEEIPFVTLKNFADQSYIVGKNNSKIRLNITKGSLPEGAMVTLSLPQPDAKENLESAEEKKILKSFSLSLMDEDGKTISLPKKAAFQILIPLTEKEEKAFDLTTITAALYDEGVSALSAKLVKEGGVNYISLVTESTGTVALFEGESLVTNNPDDGEEKKEKSGGALLWILIIAASILSVGAIFFTLWQIRKTDQKPATTEKKIAPTPSEEEKKEKERRRKIAEELNALPPIPEKMTETKKIEKILPEETMETRSFDPLTESAAEKTMAIDPVPETNAEKTITLEPISEREAEKTIKIPDEAPKQISFEDLED